jgi:hypothetical protein
VPPFGDGWAGQHPSHEEHKLCGNKTNSVIFIFLTSLEFSASCLDGSFLGLAQGGRNAEYQNFIVVSFVG